MSYKDIEKQKQYQRNWKKGRRLTEKKKSFDLLGGKCISCGIKDPRVLQIDHIKPILRKSKNDMAFESGNNLRQRISNGRRNLENLQLLCANCHQIKTYGLAKG